MKTFLVTGGAGFIGAKVCEQLLARGDAVVAVDNLNSYYDLRVKDYRLSRLLGQAMPLGSSRVRSAYANATPASAGRFTFHCLDIEDSDELDRLFQRYSFSAVFNLAARAGVRYSLVDPQVYVRTNTLGTTNVLETQRRHKVVKHVLASTSSLYAGCSMPFHEDLPVNTPNSPYAASKKGAEQMAYTYHRLHGLDVTVLRYFTVYGPAGRPDMAPFRFVKWIAEDIPVKVFGDGSQARDFTFVDDIARGTVLAEKELGFEIINLGGGRNPISLMQMVELIERFVGKRAKIAGEARQAVDMSATWADIAKASALLGWTPKTDFEQGLRQVVAWYQGNAAWLRQVQV